MRLGQIILVAALSAAALCAIMTLAWVVRWRTGNSGWVDVCWSLGVGTVGALAAILPMDSSDGWPHWRQFMVAGLVTIWSLRLGLHIAARTRGGGDDPRYRHLAANWGRDAPRRMFAFLQAQAAVGVVLAVSIALAARNPEPSFRAQDAIGAAILLCALAGETLADLQLRGFLARRKTRIAICDIGLWRWSRHPNYFFEWLVWLAYPVIAIRLPADASLSWIALAAPAAMYWVLVYASGIPPLEAHMLRTRGDAYRDYQCRTRQFFPLPKQSGE